MKTRLKKIFDKGARERGLGGLFDESRVKPPFNRLYLHHRTRFESHIQSIERIRSPETRLRIAMGFVDSPVFNAFAFPHKDQYFVGVPFGTVLILNDLYLRIMASQDVLLQIGEPGSQPKPELLDCISATSDCLPTTSDNPLGLSVGPTDPIREAYAGYLIQIAFEFMFAHEYQHIEGAHLNWLLNRGRNMMCEYWVDELRAEEALDKQVLEIDADAAAVRWSLKITMDNSNDHWRVPPCINRFADRSGKQVKSLALCNWRVLPFDGRNWMQFQPLCTNVTSAGIDAVVFLSPRCVLHTRWPAFNSRSA